MSATSVYVLFLALRIFLGVAGDGVDLVQVHVGQPFEPRHSSTKDPSSLSATQQDDPSLLSATQQDPWNDMVNEGFTGGGSWDEGKPFQKEEKHAGSAEDTAWQTAVYHPNRMEGFHATEREAEGEDTVLALSSTARAARMAAADSGEGKGAGKSRRQEREKENRGRVWNPWDQSDDFNNMVNEGFMNDGIASKDGQSNKYHGEIDKFHNNDGQLRGPVGSLGSTSVSGADEGAQHHSRRDDGQAGAGGGKGKGRLAHQLEGLLKTVGPGAGVEGPGMETSFDIPDKELNLLKGAVGSLGSSEGEATSLLKGEVGSLGSSEANLNKLLTPKAACGFDELIAARAGKNSEITGMCQGCLVRCASLASDAMQDCGLACAEGAGSLTDSSTGSLALLKEKARQQRTLKSSDPDYSRLFDKVTESQAKEVAKQVGEQVAQEIKDALAEQQQNRTEVAMMKRSGATCGEITDAKASCRFQPCGDFRNAQCDSIKCVCAPGTCSYDGATCEYKLGSGAPIPYGASSTNKFANLNPAWTGEGCKVDQSQWGSKSCDDAWEKHSFTCNDLESKYTLDESGGAVGGFDWDCSGCACLGDKEVSARQDGRRRQSSDRLGEEMKAKLGVYGPPDVVMGGTAQDSTDVVGQNGFYDAAQSFFSDDYDAVSDTYGLQKSALGGKRPTPQDARRSKRIRNDALGADEKITQAALGTGGSKTFGWYEQHHDPALGNSGQTKDGGW